MTYWEKLKIGFRWQFGSLEPIKSTIDDFYIDCLELFQYILIGIACMGPILILPFYHGFKYLFSPFYLPLLKDQNIHKWETLKKDLERIKHGN